MSKKNKLLTPKKAHEEFGIPTGKIYNWIRNKRFKYYKPEKEILFWESDLLNWLKESAVVGDENMYDDIDI